MQVHLQGANWMPMSGESGKDAYRSNYTRGCWTKDLTLVWLMINFCSYSTNDLVLSKFQILIKILVFSFFMLSCVDTKAQV